MENKLQHSNKKARIEKVKTRQPQKIQNKSTRLDKAMQVPPINTY